MSQAAISENEYVAEDHAPDPVTSHGDPTPPGKVGLWLFLASEIMFFIGILGTYIVIRSGWSVMFEAHGKSLSKVLAGTNTLVLIFSSLTMAMAVEAARKHNRGKLVLNLVLTFLCACTFMGIKYVEYTDKFHHYTIQVNEDGKQFVYDGHLHVEKGERTLKGIRVELKDDVDFNINFVGQHWVQEKIKATGAAVEEKTWPIKGIVVQEINYGPWKNLFFASYFAATGVHGLHVIGGMIPLAILAIRASRNKISPHATEYVGLYWHFVDLVWIFLFPLMYLI